MIFELLNQSLINFLYLIIALVVGITFHEFAHAAAAAFLGDSTPKFEGRLTLNPLRHLDPIGSLFILLVGFGWGKPVTFDPHFIKHGKWGIALVGIAGPIANIIIAFILIVALKFGILPQAIAQLFIIVIFINIILAVFNLLPLPPLDGSKLLRALLPESKQEFIDNMERHGPVLLFILIIADSFLGLGILSSIIGPLFNFTWNVLNF